MLELLDDLRFARTLGLGTGFGVAGFWTNDVYCAVYMSYSTVYRPPLKYCGATGICSLPNPV